MQQGKCHGEGFALDKHLRVCTAAWCCPGIPGAFLKHGRV